MYTSFVSLHRFGKYLKYLPLLVIFHLLYLEFVDFILWGAFSANKFILKPTKASENVWSL
jgi:hypothetical protein